MDESPELPKKPSFQMERGLTFSVSLENAKRKREDDPGDLASEKKRKVSMEEPIKMPINLSISVQHPVKPGFGRSMTAPVGQIRSTSSESKQSEESEEGPELVRSITTKHGQTLQGKIVVIRILLMCSEKRRHHHRKYRVHSKCCKFLSGARCWCGWSCSQGRRIKVGPRELQVDKRSR